MTSKRNRSRMVEPLTVVPAALMLLVACGGSSDGVRGTPPPVSEPPPTACDPGQEFAGTFEAIQEVIFERHGCTERVCHGSAAQGGLDLSPEAAYASLIARSSFGNGMPRVTPGDRTRSYLYRKLAAATEPGSFDIAGAPMPSGRAPISPDELEAVRLWIYAGAPRTGTVGGTEALLDACLPPPKPITIEPLPPPPSDEGFQLVMPEWLLPQNSEHELCFATYYDVSADVPERFRQGDRFRFRGFELRQDPQSHHLTLYYPLENFAAGGVDTRDPSFGTWTCAGGERAGAECEPADPGSCGGGICRSEPRPSFGCIGYGPSDRAPLPIGGAQQAQAYTAFRDGVYAELPMKGIVYWNTHAFNATDEDHLMNGRLNYIYAEDAAYFARTIFDVSRIFAPNAEPYTEQTVCHDHVLPRGARLFELTSHTHKRGKRFTVTAPDGALLYESFVYNDPVREEYDPPLAFDAPHPADRTLRYCALFNNGVGEDGAPDPETVTRASRIPQSATQTTGSCTPVACVAGAIGAACDGADDDAACDSSPGSGDGDCDACRITFGESTENEMFILIGTFYVDPEALGDGAAGVAAAPATSELAFPGHSGCASMGHRAHAGSRDPHARHAAHERRAALAE